MQSNIEMTQGYDRLRAILASYPDDSDYWSEAQNRFQFIDRLLLECLGWEQPNIEVEVTDEAGGRCDYLLGKPVRAALEAKKEAIKFDILPGTRPQKARPLRPLVLACKVLDKVVKQVIPYCAMNGAQLAIVSNGPQLVIFQASIPSLSPLDSECYVFNGFSDYEKNFPFLWKLLSPEGITENVAQRDLAIHRNPRIPEKASTAIGEPNAYRYRSSFQENLRSLGSILLDNVDETPSVKKEFYRECYVSLDANNRHLLLSKKIIDARYRRVGNDGIIPAKVGAKVSKGKVVIDGPTYSGPQGAKPIVVVGDVGVGKTSFFENLFEQLSEKQKIQTYYIHVNLGERATLSRDVKSFILHEIPNIMKKSYGISFIENEFVEAVYENEISEFDKSTEGAWKGINDEKYRSAKIEYLKEKIGRSDEHLRACMSYLHASKNKQILLVIDNADQRDFATQQEAFLIAQEIASYRTVLVFVALRPSTFYQSKLQGSLSGYQNQVLTISPPPADEVIRKRITFAVRVAEGRAAPAALEGVELNLDSIVTFLNVTLRSIKASNDIRMFLSNITGGNTRMVIELMSSFCGSPNVESERIVEIERETGRYQVPLHEFTKHALLGEYSHFNALSSMVACNVFDITAADQHEHFLSCLLIAYISSPMGIKNHDGFVRGDQIIAEMMRLGFQEDQTRFTLERLAKKRLIETPHGHYRELTVAEGEKPDQFQYRATSIGLYHIRHWIADFSFLDATSTDTPIFDKEIRGVVFDLANSFNIAERYERALRFRTYLELSWQQSNFDANYYDILPIFSANRSFASVKRFLETPKYSRHYRRK